MSLTLFNLVVDNIIITWLSMAVEYRRVYQDGLGETVVRCFGEFYADDVMVGSCDLDWLQHAMNVLVGLFRSYGLAANVAKSCSIYKDSADKHRGGDGLLACICIVHGGRDNSGNELDGALLVSRRGKQAEGIN